MVQINVTEESKYPPTATPLDIFITMTESTFPRQVIGKLHASDQDPQDILTYRLDSATGGLFSIDSSDGKVIAEALQTGLYTLNVTVSDGRFSTHSGIRVDVWAPSQQDLVRGFTLRLANLSAEEFLADHWRMLQRSLSHKLGVPMHELHVASLQQHQGQEVQVLLVHRAQHGTARTFNSEKITAMLEQVKANLGLSILSVKHDGCIGDDCAPLGCKSSVLLSDERVSHYSTARNSFITPGHSWESVCSCNGKKN